MYCSLVLLFFLSTSSCQIIKNGDFENGEKDPWICRGCQGQVAGAGHDSINSFYASHRTESWNGPAQFLNSADFDALDSLEVSFSFSLMPEQDIEASWKLMCQDEDGKQTEILFEGSFAANQWTSEVLDISLPESVRTATTIDLFMEGTPESASWRIDDISMTPQGTAQTTTTTTTEKSTSTTASTTSTTTSTTTLLTTTIVASDCSSVLDVESEEDDSWHGLITISVDEDVSSWKVALEFDNEIEALETPLGIATGSGKKWIVENKGFDGELDEGTVFEMRFEVYYSGDFPNIIDIKFNDAELCEEAQQTTTAANDCMDTVIVESETENKWHGLVILISNEDTSNWEIEFRFNHDLDSLVTPLGKVSGTGKDWVVSNNDWDGDLTAGVELEFRFEVYYSGRKPQVVDFAFNGEYLC